jgi:hypothetical protein
MSTGNVPVYKLAQLPQKSKNVKSNYASLKSVTIGLDKKQSLCRDNVLV